jgi:hypothetical protein
MVAKFAVGFGEEPAARQVAGRELLHGNRGCAALKSRRIASRPSAELARIRPGFAAIGDVASAVY